MTPRPVSKQTTIHYTWGGPDGASCDAWYLVRAPELHVIAERMPPGTSEKRHFHLRARQFFYVLEGELTIELAERCVVLARGQGLEITPGEAHRVLNDGVTDVDFLVTSQPPSHGDRIEDGAEA